MGYGTSILSIIPLRQEPKDTSEMISQVLFGELFSIVDEFKNWIKIKLEWDGYEGWADKKQILSLEDSDYKKLIGKKHYLSTDLIGKLKNSNENTPSSIVIGSSFYGINNQSIKLNNSEFTYSGKQTDPDFQYQRSDLLKFATKYLNSPYLWGGRTPFGIDCSGFVQMAYKLCGKRINRDSVQQAAQGETINFISDAVPGDLLFFDNDEGEIIHVGILMKDQKIIHASGKVRIDLIDHSGIYNENLRRYTHKLRLIKSVF